MDQIAELYGIIRYYDKSFVSVEFDLDEKIIINLPIKLFIHNEQKIQCGRHVMYKIMENKAEKIIFIDNKYEPDPQLMEILKDI